MLPNFIIIGAAKAGTTALYHYLADHPQVFMSKLKETNFFAFGLDAEGRLLYGDPDVHRYPVQTLADYETLFTDAGTAAAIGEASPIYLECPQSAGRIRDLIPNARIICCLRHPVDRAYSDYQMYLRRRRRRVEPARDLTTASEWALPDSRWMKLGRYHGQLVRYFDAFPRGHIHVSLSDDLKRDTPGVTRDLYRFLGVDPTFEPDLTTPHNVGGTLGSTWLESLLSGGALKSTLEPWVPKEVANWARRLRTRNLQPAPALPAELKRELTRHFHDDIARTSDLIGRNLSHWL